MTDDHERNRWIADRLGAPITRLEQVRSGPAGYTLAVETDAGRWYFKACAAPSAHEPALTAALDTWLPGYGPAALAADRDRGWLLMADAGPPVRELIRADGDRARSETMLRRYAALQQGTIPYVARMLALGVPDRRWAALPALYVDLLADTPALMIGEPGDVSEDDLARLRAFDLRALGERLASYGLPDTLHHDDFHTGNVCVRDGQVRIVDWGESFIAHPFYALMIAQRDAAYILHYDGPALARMRDAYLSCWVDYGPLERLRAALDAALQLAALVRALTWWQIARQAEPQYREEIADAVPYWLLTFLNNTPLELGE